MVLGELEGQIRDFGGPHPAPRPYVCHPCSTQIQVLVQIMDRGLILAKHGRGGEEEEEEEEAGSRRFRQFQLKWRNKPFQQKPRWCESASSLQQPPPPLPKGRRRSCASQAAAVRKALPPGSIVGESRSPCVPSCGLQSLAGKAPEPRPLLPLQWLRGPSCFPGSRSCRFGKKSSPAEGGKVPIPLPGGEHCLAAGEAELHLGRRKAFAFQSSACNVDLPLRGRMATSVRCDATTPC